MKRSTRIALVLLIGVLLVVGVTAGAVAHSMQEAGPIVVRVTGEKQQIAIALPGAFVTGVIQLIPRCVFNEIDREARSEVEPYLPIIKTALRELADLPDAYLVTVHDHGESVRIVKKENALIVQVSTVEEQLFISVPIRTVETIVGKFDRGILAI